ncbi:hypothetical protein GO755_33655 [Spirosoma sp. HMF4905]|uniref:Uncharacterized protein n=1 Tax=Spirosoma arboris TaxID=2682092 RepID=A0A7K1SMK1_9BACT|nr:hypothetical protein [Spirosoma arboris]MVM35021.1 hypothetical protein [Spirosoma arboris]
MARLSRLHGRKQNTGQVHAELAKLGGRRDFDNALQPGGQKGIQVLKLARAGQPDQRPGQQQLNRRQVFVATDQPQLNLEKPLKAGCLPEAFRSQADNDNLLIGAGIATEVIVVHKLARLQETVDKTYALTHWSARIIDKFIERG